MKKLYLVGFLCAALSACGTIQLDLTPRTQGESIHGVATRQDRAVVITTKDETYNGHWTYMQGGSMGVGIASVGGIVATGTAVGFSLTGAGNIVATAADGHHIRCVFNFSQVNNTGAGECETDEGAVYDLQIAKTY